MAARGMISMLDNKNVDDGIFEDKEKMSRLKKQLAERINSIWCDDFDRGFFETWIGFINYYRRHGLSEAGSKQSGNQNPNEQK
jgi:hypothetical protein